MFDKIIISFALRAKGASKFILLMNKLASLRRSSLFILREIVRIEVGAGPYLSGTSLFDITLNCIIVLSELIKHRERMLISTKSSNKQVKTRVFGWLWNRMYEKSVKE